MTDAPRMTSDEMLRAMPTDTLLQIARNELSLSPLVPVTVESVIDALARQTRLQIALIAALAGRTST